MLWDTAGQERFDSVAPTFVRGSNGLVLVYDSQKLDTFNALDRYLSLFLENVKMSDLEVLPIVVMGNKCDLHQSVVSAEALDRWMDRHRIPASFLVSARTGENIDAAFGRLLDLIPLSDAPQLTGAFATSLPKRTETACAC
jgi:small GTP-binding protein